MFENSISEFNYSFETTTKTLTFQSNKAINSDKHKIFQHKSRQRQGWQEKNL